VVNPGLITNYETILANFESGSDETMQHHNLEVPCIIFLDSFAAHEKDEVAHNVRHWLNHEWKKNSGGKTDVFTEQSIKLFAPEGIVGVCLLFVHLISFIS